MRRNKKSFVARACKSAFWRGVRAGKRMKARKRGRW